MTAAGRVRFEGIYPILSVKSISASLDYYENVLGFKRSDWVTEDATFACVERDNGAIYLCQGGQGYPGMWVWVGVEDVEQLYAEYQQSGAKIQHGPANYPWALEIRVEDPDGHVLRFGSDPKSNRPFEEFRP